MYYYSSDFLRGPKQFDKNFPFASIKFKYSEKALKFEDILGKVNPWFSNFFKFMWPFSENLDFK